MFLANLKTESEKEAFVCLAYLVAKADGSLGYGERTLINLYMEEMGMDCSEYQVRNKPLINLCHIFSEQHLKQLVFINLLFLAIVDGYSSFAQKCILEVIQRELTVSSIEAKRYEDEMKILHGSYSLNYMD